MFTYYTAEVFRAFLFGVAGLIGGGLLFESGRSYVKTAGSNQFKGKVEALPFFFAVLILGMILQRLDPYVDAIVYVFPPLTRAGIMVIGAMFLFNYSVNNFNYDDNKSLGVYLIGVVIALWSFL